MEERATTYQSLFFRSLQLEGVFPDSRICRPLELDTDGTSLLRLDRCSDVWEIRG